MRAAIFLILTGCATIGCASKQPRSAQISTTVPADDAPMLRRPPAAALVFNPPSANPCDYHFGRNDPATAFVGYETFKVDTVWVRQDDRFRGDEKDQSRFDRRAVSTRVVELAR